jgi:WXXGXW repeat (2 copies)
MRKLLLMALFSGGMILAANSVEAQHYYVSVHPEARVITRPIAPSPRHVWVASEWTWRNGAYVEVPGYWALPPHGHRVWVEGHWAKESRGSYWIPGHWR